MFNEGRTDGLEEDQRGRPILVTIDLEENVEQNVCENDHFTGHFT